MMLCVNDDVQRSAPVYGDLVLLFKGRFDMESTIFALIFYPDVVNHQGEIDRAHLVCP